MFIIDNRIDLEKTLTIKYLKNELNLCFFMKNVLTITFFLF